MKIRRILVSAAAALLLFGCQKQDVSLMPQKADETIVNQDGEKLKTSSLEQGHIRLQLSEEMTELAETDPDAFIQLFAELGVKSVAGLSLMPASSRKEPARQDCIVGMTSISMRRFR